MPGHDAPEAVSQPSGAAATAAAAAVAAAVIRVADGGRLVDGPAVRHVPPRDVHAVSHLSLLPDERTSTPRRTTRPRRTVRRSRLETVATSRHVTDLSRRGTRAPHSTPLLSEGREKENNTSLSSSRSRHRLLGAAAATGTGPACYPRNMRNLRRVRARLARRLPHT